VSWITWHPAEASQVELGAAMLTASDIGLAVRVCGAESRFGVGGEYAWLSQANAEHFTCGNADGASQRNEHRTHVGALAVKFATGKNFTHITYAAANDAVITLHVGRNPFVQQVCLPEGVGFVSYDAICVFLDDAVSLDVPAGTQINIQ